MFSSSCRYGGNVCVGGEEWSAAVNSTEELPAGWHPLQQQQQQLQQCRMMMETRPSSAAYQHHQQQQYPWYQHQGEWQHRMAINGSLVSPHNRHHYQQHHNYQQQQQQQLNHYVVNASSAVTDDDVPLRCHVNGNIFQHGELATPVWNLSSEITFRQRLYRTWPGVYRLNKPAIISLNLYPKYPVPQKSDAQMSNEFIVISYRFNFVNYYFFGINFAIFNKIPQVVF